MSTAPAAPANPASVRDQELYRAALQEAAAGGVVLMGKLVAAARLALQTQEAASRDLRERDALADSANQLRRHEQQLCQSYPQALLQAFHQPEGGKKAASLSIADVQFDQLELMDDVQVQATVTLARVQQVAMLAAEASLAELNTLMCSVLGMHSVRADVNPLRPQSYVNALRVVVAQTQLSQEIQSQWFNAMSATLGLELRTLYVALCARLRKDGVVSVMYAVSAGPSGQGSRAFAQAGQMNPGARFAMAAGTDATPQMPANDVPGTRARGKDETVLTLDKLRKLLSGELTQAPTGNRVQQFAAQFTQQFEDAASGAEGVPSDFANTVPAALQALTEMKQVEQVVQSLEHRRSGSAAGQTAPQQHSVEGQRQALRNQARDVAQVLSLEVVTLMVDNMARDARLLEPVRQVIRNLEPALLRLALVDQRFFTDKQHPARRLLQELTHRSLAFDTPEAAGFDAFVRHLQLVLAPLFNRPVENAEIFEQSLEALRQQWAGDAQAAERGRDAAVEVLQHAEARNLLAEKVASEIEAHPDSAAVASVVMDFLCGPWSQVVAQARIKQGAGSATAEKFEALVPALLWSAHPELARANPAKLTRVVPRLLTTLREGLDTIHYPGTRTSAFLEALMAIHQQFFRPAAVSDAPPASAPSASQGTLARAHLMDDGDPWIAPEEALASNFVDLQDMSAPPTPSDAPLVPDMLLVPEPQPQPLAEGDFPLGTWVEMWANGQWVRTQLTWASPHGTLFLFTGAFGTTQSITRRSRDKLLAGGKLRLVSGQPIDEGALDAVAQVAMRNSLDSAF
jgi:hypothetical protein